MKDDDGGSEAILTAVDRAKNSPCLSVALCMALNRQFLFGNEFTGQTRERLKRLDMFALF